MSKPSRMSQSVNSTAIGPGTKPASCGAGEEGANGFASPRAIVDGPVVDVHAHEPVGQGGVETAGVAQRVVEGLLAIGPGQADAFLQEPCDQGYHLRPQVLADHVAAQREGETGLLKPPGAQVNHFMKPAVLVKELSFVDQEARRRPAPQRRPARYGQTA